MGQPPGCTIHATQETAQSIENWINRFRLKNKDRRLIIYVHKEIEQHIYGNKKTIYHLRKICLSSVTKKFVMLSFMKKWA